MNDTLNEEQPSESPDTESPKKLFVSMLKDGTHIDAVFVITRKTVGVKKNGDQFLSFTFGDKTGNINGVAWDNVDEINQAAEPGDFASISAKVSQYNGSPQLVVSKMVKISPDQITPLDFIASSSRNPDAMFERLQKLTRAMQTPYLKDLTEAFWNDSEFVRKFKTAPAAKRMHHNYIGGLLEHTLSMAILIDRIAGHYSGVDMDMLLTGAVLHDIGKTREIGFDYRIEYTDEGRLLNHIVIGISMLDAKLAQVPDFPADQANLLKHMIVSHHGYREFGSPEPPKTIEAVLLNYIDEIDAKVNGIRDFIQSHPSNDNWTPYHKMMERQFYCAPVKFTEAEARSAEADQQDETAED